MCQHLRLVGVCILLISLPLVAMWKFICVCILSVNHTYMFFYLKSVDVFEKSVLKIWDYFFKVLSKLQNHAGCYIKYIWWLFWKEDDQSQLRHFILVPRHAQQCWGDRTVHLSSLTTLIRDGETGMAHTAWDRMGAEETGTPSSQGAATHGELMKRLTGSFISCGASQHTPPLALLFSYWRKEDVESADNNGVGLVLIFRLDIVMLWFMFILVSCYSAPGNTSLP